MVDDDELVEGYDGEEEEPEEDPLVRQKQIEYEEKVDRNIAIIRNPKKHPVDKRRAAALALGELGYPKAIEALVLVYRKDKSPGMKDAAAKSLSMFRALQHALDDEDEEVRNYALDLQDAIVLEGKMGKPASLPRRPLQIAAGILAVLMIVFFGLGAVLGGQKTQQQAADSLATTEANYTPTPADPLSFATALQSLYAAVSQDASSLRTEMLNIGRGTAPNCALTFNSSDSVSLPEFITAESHPQITTVADKLNTAIPTINEIRAEFVAACNGGTAITGDDAVTYNGQLTDIQINLRDVPALLQEVGVTLPPSPTPRNETPTPSATPTELPTLTPEPTLDPSLINRHVLGLNNILTTMTGARGYNTQILSYWTDVQNSGSTQGCLQLPPPVLPVTYVIPANEIALVPSEITAAAERINAGLALSKQSWEQFDISCADGSFAENAGIQVQAATTAQNAFDEAQTQINQLRQR